MKLKRRGNGGGTKKEKMSTSRGSSRQHEMSLRASSVLTMYSLSAGRLQEVISALPTSCLI